ncbi:hypothetical protein ACLB2K_059056 [Fragaria x ananassa]
MVAGVPLLSEVYFQLNKPNYWPVDYCKAVDFAITQGFFHLILETDAQMVQRQLEEAGSPNTSHLGRIYEDLWRKLELAGSWKICYTRRDRNDAAHSMAA